MALPASDTFLQSSGSPQTLAVYSASWTQSQGVWTVPSGTGDVRPNSAATDCLAHWNADTPNASQYSQVITATGWAASGRYVGPAVRVTTSTGYALQCNSTSWVLGRIVSGAWTQVGTGSQTFADGDVIRLEVETLDANTVRLRMYRALAATPTSFTQFGGNIDDTNAARITAVNFLGMTGYDAAPSDPCIAFWEGGNLSAAVALDHADWAELWMRGIDVDADVSVWG